MSYVIEYNAEDGILEARVEGTISPQIVEELTREIARLVHQHQCFLVLADYRNAKLEIAALDIYDLPQKITSIIGEANEKAASIRRGIVVSQDIKDFEFYETVCINRGQRIKLFRDMESAKTWLLKK